MTRFAELYGRLNPAQKDAVDTIEGPVMVIAGPGTGKTTILTLRIANILQKTDTPPSGILAITFTEAGAKAMRMKLREIIGGRADEVRIHTFHGFASSVIAEFREHFVHLDQAKQMTDIDAEALIRDILRDERFQDVRPFGNPDFYIGKIISAMSDARREALTPDAVRAYALQSKKRTETDPDSLSSRGATKGQLKAEAKKYIEKCERTVIFADVYETYESRKRKEKRLDFDDLLIELLVALRTDELLLRLIQEKFLYILVDEHQDTNDAQNLIIKMVADFFESPNLFIVGDEKQAIFRFQGASVENFLTFQKTWRNMKLIRLTDNYRSHQSILDASFSMIENNYEEGEHEELRVKLRAGRADAPHPVELVMGEDMVATEKYVASALRRIQDADPHTSVAIITKTNRDLERILRFFEQEGIAVSSERSVDIFSHPLGNLFFDLADFFIDLSRTDALGKTIAAGLWGLSFEDSALLLRALRAGTSGDLLQKIPALRPLQKALTTESPVQFVVRLGEDSGFLARALLDPVAVAVWRGIVKLAESLSREGALEDPRILLERMVSYRASAESRSVKIPVGTPELPVKAMTAHSSKGLEFDYVFMPYVTEESWFSRSRSMYFVLPQSAREEDDIKDTRRLFYVALTRARKHVTLLFGGEDADGKTLTPLRFLSELDQAHISRVTIPHTEETKIVLRGTKARTGEYVSKLHVFAKDTLFRKGLSVTALNHFLTCPNMFLFQSVLKVPEAPHPLAEKGTLMHLALSSVWGEKERTSEKIEEIIVRTADTFFMTSLLHRFEKEALKAEIRGDATHLSTELLSHFETKGTVFSETWSETHFETKRGTLALHGKLDAVIDTGSDVLVFDYKTRQGMSDNEIKGLTKNSSGDYFRQLVYYTILLSKDARFKGKTIIPTLVFVKPDAKGRIATATLEVTSDDVRSVEKDIESLVEAVHSGSLVSSYCQEKECEWCRLRKTLA